jgi:serine/threonine protein kinase
VEALFHAARERNADEQRAFLDAACVGDSDLRRDVETLLQQAADGSFLSEPALADTAAVIAGGAATNFRGRRLGVYEIQSLVGAGGMGEVYRARDTRLKRDVAVKILPTKFTSDRDRLARFEREARLLAALNHPHIASIYGVEESEGIRALVLELVDGETLADRLARGPLAAKEALHIARQLAEALDAAHEKGIVHRDLKPANVKITPSGSVKVLDFGLAKAIAGDGRQPHQSENPTDTFSGTHEGVILGTAAYMSPEQARGEAVDKRTDIWAFGCVMYEAVSGRRAFARATFSRTLDAVLHEEPDWDALPASTPRPLQRLIRRCLEKDAVRRQRDIGDARAELDDPIDANSSERSVRLRRWRWPAAAAAAVVVAGGAAVSFFSARDGRPVSAMTSRVIDQLTFDAGALTGWNAAGVCLGPCWPRKPRYLGPAAAQRCTNPTHQ